MRPDLEFRQGNSVEITGVAREADKTPLDLSGATVTLAIVDQAGTPPEAARLVAVGTVGETPGAFAVALTAAETRAVPAGDYFVAVVAVWADGRRRQLPEAGPAYRVRIYPEILTTT